jgi:hypothetical protein
MEKIEYVNNWKKDNDAFLCDAFGFEDGPQFKFLTGIFISPSTTKEQFPFLQEVLQADATPMSFGKYTLYSEYGTNANGTMSALGFALLFGNEDKQSWTQFWNFIKTHPTINQSKYTSSPTRTRVLYLRWKKLSLLREGSFVASIVDRTL